ncbi:MAG: helicase-related protein [Microthrixaceae bacterium]
MTVNTRVAVGPRRRDRRRDRCRPSGGHTVYGLDRRHVHGRRHRRGRSRSRAGVLRCEHCGSAVTVAAPTRRPVGRRAVSPVPLPGPLPRRGPPRLAATTAASTARARTRRVVTGEHTGLLQRRDREALETAFKDGTAPDAPNVLTATPTLEMGIDIGDLSAVMLTSVPRNPASYIQRVGRAGRATGNSLGHHLRPKRHPRPVLPGRTRGDDRRRRPTTRTATSTPSETLHRQYVAYLMDRMADGAIDADADAQLEVGDLMTRRATTRAGCS